MNDIESYKKYLDGGTWDHQNWSDFETLPKSRYESFKFVMDHMRQNNLHTVIELGTCRSFMGGAYEGCNKNDIKYWNENDPEKWDWGAGAFGLVMGLCVDDVEITTLDLISDHINRCKVMTERNKHKYTYIVSDSLTFLKNVDKKYDIIYVDTGDMTPIEPTAKLQLDEAKIIVEKQLLNDGGLILIDDVKSQVPKEFGCDTGLGKSKYSLDYFTNHGYEIIFEGYQYILRRK